MVNLREKITKFCTAMFFLLAILLQPIHQLEHIAHEHTETQQVDISFRNQHATHCNLCDFIFSPTIELTLQTLEIPYEFDLIELKQENKLSGFYNSASKSHKQLRAPPYNA